MEREDIETTSSDLLHGGSLTKSPCNCFLLATAMHKASKFELLNVAKVDARGHYTFSGTGEVFSVVRPEMSKEMERKVRKVVRRFLGEEGLLWATGGWPRPAVQGWRCWGGG